MVVVVVGVVVLVAVAVAVAVVVWYLAVSQTIFGLVEAMEVVVASVWYQGQEVW